MRYLDMRKETQWWVSRSSPDRLATSDAIFVGDAMSWNGSNELIVIGAMNGDEEMREYHWMAQYPWMSPIP